METIRSATLNDIPSLHKLINSAYRGESSKKGWTTEADLLGGQRTDPELLQKMIENPKARIELLCDQNEILGCVYLEEKSEGLYLGMLTVNPEIQAKGLGKKLLQHAEDLAKNLNPPAIVLQVIKGREELVQFYLRRGFYFTGNSEPFPHEDPRFGLPKMKLEFLEMRKDLK